MQDISSAREQISRLIETGDRAAAEQALRAALERWSNQPGIKVLRGEFLARTGEVQAAAESYAAIARKHPDFFWAGVRLVRLLRLARDCHGQPPRRPRSISLPRLPVQLALSGAGAGLAARGRRIRLREPRAARGGVVAADALGV